MRLHITALLFLIAGELIGQNLLTPFEKSNGLNTASYEEVNEFYKKLAEKHSNFKYEEIGLSDAGLSLYLCIYSDQGIEFSNKASRINKTVIMLNNGIHPGEPDGVDASMMWFRDLLDNSKNAQLFKDLIIISIPLYNIGGSLNTSEFYRTNQNGPRVKAFRGNSQNLDLNRDFIKVDSRNAQIWQRVFNDWMPHFYLETHVSNGADYPYTMTLLFTQEDKLGSKQGQYLREIMEPELYKAMANANDKAIPYVNVFGRAPDSGYNQFFDSPRYSTGYAALFQTFSMLTETHMLKAFAARVQSTYTFIDALITYTAKNAEFIRQMVEDERENNRLIKTYNLKWELDTAQHATLAFDAFEWELEKSQISGLNRLKYNDKKINNIDIPFYNIYRGTNPIDVPQAYIIPKGWYKVLDKLENAGVEMERLEEDKAFYTTFYKIGNYETLKRPFEGHFYHYKVSLTKESDSILFNKGDFIVKTNQRHIRFILEVLEPEAVDSYFRWNFFDNILGEKEGFSAYVFEDIAIKLLKDKPDLKKALEIEKLKNETLANSHDAQLQFIYDHSPYKEPSYMRYPVYRLD